ncbi:hypothetical protein [Roseiconus nitratireducens]|nr:hypothetical protein [Roseiconus nitratireducens]
MATIFVVFLAVVVASYNDQQALAKLLIRIIVALLIVGFSLNAAIFIAICWHGWSHRPDIPAFSSDEMLFDEKNAGGYSLLSWHTRRFPSQNNLHVSIARDKLWIRPRLLPSVAIGFQLDQVHQIPLVAVEEVIVDLNEFDITYRSVGTSRSIRLWLRKPEEFLAAIRSSCHQARFDIRTPERSITQLITNWLSK